MTIRDALTDPKLFSEILFEKMKFLNPGINDLELYEFRYGLQNITPEMGWSSIEPAPSIEIEARLNDIDFYSKIQIKPRLADRIVLDENIVQLTEMLFAGLVSGQYSTEWVNRHFYFDIRGFYFLHRTVYFTEKVFAHVGNTPYRIFEPLQKHFEGCQDIGYKAFKLANAQVDHEFIESVKKLISVKGTPVVLAIAGPTAAGKTEIVEQLHISFEQTGKKTTSIELDNFLTDRDYREEHGIHTLGKAALHLDLLKESLAQITQGQKITIPRYDFVFATSSHDLTGKLKPGYTPIEVEPADIIFIEGNFPFLIAEIVHLIGIKVVYLTDDPVRLKRKWKRDIDYRKKYEPTYFRNRFFKDQFIMAHKAYIPQMELCDMIVDTTGAALWITPEVAQILDQNCTRVQGCSPAFQM